MAISFVGSARTTASTTSLTAPAHLAGDLLVVHAFPSAATGIITVPDPFTPVASQSSSGTSYAVGIFVATEDAPTGMSIGTWSSAQHIICVVYRGVEDIGAFAASVVTSTADITIPGLTLEDDSGSSWVVTFGAHKTASDVGSQLPDGTTFRDDAVAIGNSRSAAWDTDGGVSSWAGDTITVDGTDTARGFSLELIAASAGPGPVIVMAPHPAILVREAGGGLAVIEESAGGGGPPDTPSFPSAGGTARSWFGPSMIRIIGID